MAVRQLAQPFAKLDLGLIDQRRAGFVDGLGAVFVDQRQHPLAGDVVAGDHRAQIERDHFRAAHHVQDRVPQILTQLAAIDDLDAGR